MCSSDLVTQRVTGEVDQLLTERTTWTALFGGVLGAAELMDRLTLVVDPVALAASWEGGS